MYKKNLWRSVIAGTLALAMTLTPAGTTYANAEFSTETTTEMAVIATTEDTSTEEAIECSSTEVATNEENTTEDSEWPVYALDADEDTTESPTDTNDAATGIDELADTTELDADMASEIPVTAKYFPDDTFRECISDSFDNDNDGILSANEINNCTSINFTNRNITSLDGIQYFTQLESLDCYSNNLTSLDLSKNTKLTYIRCSRNNLTNLILDQNSQLTYLDLYN